MSEQNMPLMPLMTPAAEPAPAQPTQSLQQPAAPEMGLNLGASIPAAAPDPRNEDH